MNMQFYGAKTGIYIELQRYLALLHLHRPVAIDQCILNNLA